MQNQFGLTLEQPHGFDKGFSFFFILWLKHKDSSDARMKFKERTRPLREPVCVLTTADGHGVTQSVGTSF